MMHIERYQEIDKEKVIELVLGCQNDGSRPLVGIADQPELLCVEKSYFSGGGYFWVAKEEDMLIGSIGLMNAGDGIGILKKFFVCEAYRGKPHHVGQKLYLQALAFAKEHAFKELILDTPKNTQRAHNFYEKAGFMKIDKKDLPVRYHYPYHEKDCDFFRLTLSE